MKLRGLNLRLISAFDLGMFGDFLPTVLPWFLPTSGIAIGKGKVRRS
jgi:hypothetical protein